jgi:hypothetical protein
MKRIFLIIFLLAPALFASNNSNDVLSSMPLSKMFWSLFQERNIIGQNDCSNKCGRYLRALVAEGHTAEIVVIKPHTSRMLHAIIKLTEGDKVTYLDPTRGTLSADLDILGSYKKSIAHSELASLGAQYK